MNPYKIAFISLGCAKNLINTEQMMALCRDAGYTVTGDPDGADVAVLNTCGFIEAAKSEAIDNILELAELKAQGRLKKRLVAGCLSQRYREEIKSDLPEVDGLLGTGSYNDVVPAVEELMAGERPEIFGDIHRTYDGGDRWVTTPPWTAYLKIAEGCSNGCAFCVIPRIRGKYRSRPMAELLSEAESLARRGVKELIVIAQDITRYGTDLKDGASLAGLLRELCKLDFHWIRLHYLYPEAVTDELIDVIASEKKIVHYLDIPIQHANDGILKAMRRRTSKEELRGLFGKLRAAMPDVVIRTSLICGLPGEGEAEFEELCDFLREQKLQRVGAFQFSPEEGTLAAAMENQVDPRPPPAEWSWSPTSSPGSWTSTTRPVWAPVWKCCARALTPTAAAMWAAPTPTRWRSTGGCCSPPRGWCPPGSSCGCGSPACPTAISPEKSRSERV